MDQNTVRQFWTRMLTPFCEERGNFGGSKQKQRQAQTQQVSQQQTQQTQVSPEDPREAFMRQRAQEADLFRMFLMQREAAQQFGSPLMTPHAQEGLNVLNEQFRDERDLRGFQGPASPIENARAIGVQKYMAQLQNDAFQKRMMLGQQLGPSPGGIAMQGLGQQLRLAGSPMATSTQGTTTGSGMTSGAGSQRGFGMGDLGSLMTGAGNLWGAYNLWGGQGGSPSTGAPYRGGSMWGY